MADRVRSSRWRHIVWLLPLGAGVGLIVGLLFRDVLFGLAAGAALGAAFGLLLAIRNPTSG